MKCPHCGDLDYRYNVINERRIKAKALKTGCCDVFIRWCPDPELLLQLPNITPEQRDYLQRVSNLDWFSGAVAAVLLQIEAKTQASVEVAV